MRSLRPNKALELTAAACIVFEVKDGRILDGRDQECPNARALRPQLKRGSLGGAGEPPDLNEEGHMDPGVFLAPVGGMVAIIAALYVAVAKIIRLRATLAESPSADVTARLEALERGVEGLQQELAETQERLDFAERLLTKPPEERRIGS